MSDHKQDSGSLPFAPTLRKTIILLLVGFATPIIILLLLTQYITKGNPTPAASAPIAAAASSASSAPLKPASAASGAKQ